MHGQAREVKVRKAGIADRARLASELRDMDMEVGADFPGTRMRSLPACCCCPGTWQLRLPPAFLQGHAAPGLCAMCGMCGAVRLTPPP